MDHVGDMLHYIQTGLERAWGYSGILSWKGIDRYRESPPEDDDWKILDGDRAQAIMWAKDGCFRVTIEACDSHELSDEFQAPEAGCPEV